MAYKKAFRKIGKKIVRHAKKRYMRKGNLNVGKIMRDVSYLKSVLNPEKKRFQLTNTDQGIGQCTGNVSAFYVTDITPVPAQGTTSVTRNGNSLKLHSSYFKFQFQQQSATTSQISFKIMVIEVKGTPYTSLGGTMVPNMFNANSFITGGSIIDYNSDRNPEAFKNYKVLCTKVVTLPCNQISTQTMIKNVSFGMKYRSHHVKFLNDGSQSIATGQLVLLILANNGNASTGTVSTLGGTQSTAINTGALLQQDITHYYYDN